MMKVLYIIMMWVSFLWLLVIYFTNITFTSWQVLFLWSRSSTISVGWWLLLQAFVGFIFWINMTLLISSLMKSKPKDFDEYDL